MADTQEAPQTAVPDGNAQEGGLIEAQNALLKLQEPVEETPETEEGQPTEEEESQPEEEDESLEEESEETSGEDSEEADEEVGEELYAVTVDGEEVGVTLDELMKGYSRQSDYTKKTQQIAEDRRETGSLQEKYNSEIAQIQAERQQYMENLQQIIENSSGDVGSFANIDWKELKDSDPIEYVTKREEFREAQENVQSLKSQRESVRQKQARDAESLHKAAMEEEHGKLVAALPEWNDPKKKEKLSSDIKSYGLSQGFTEEELGSLVDHRSVLVLLKALKYDNVQSSDMKAKKLKNKPRLIRSGKGRSSSQANKSKRTAKMKRLQSSGHVDDAVSILEDMFNS